MVHFSSVTIGLALAVTAAAIPAKEVVGFKESAPGLFHKYKPFLKVDSGCVPFPAVNETGETG
jgi:hypothetical protein